VSVPPVPRTALGRGGIQVSRLALGSWRTYDRISRDRGLAVMKAAREAGINFLDDARYNDETGDAPLPTGYSEVVFGELFRAAGWKRDDTVVSNKLWWEFWPDESPAQELASSLGRMGFDYVDLIYSEVPPDGVALEDAVEEITGLIRAGTARAWGTLNWTPEQMERAWQIADRTGGPGPTATQPPYSLVRRESAEDPDMRRLAADRGVAIVASYTLAGGVLTGKYDQDPGAGRAAGLLGQPRYGGRGGGRPRARRPGQRHGRGAGQPGDGVRAAQSVGDHGLVRGDTSRAGPREPRRARPGRAADAGRARPPRRRRHVGWSRAPAASMPR
jgi:aryl-alcohol dehydrogenase-like predicted oxidoreductase